MSRIFHFIFSLLLGVYMLAGLTACDQPLAKEDRVLKVGVIAPLTGSARPWGLVTVRCAQVVAQYHNDRGGFDVGGEKVKIELMIADDAFDASQAAAVAHDMMAAGVHYVIGPLGDATTVSASRVMDGRGVFYVHYGFDQSIQNSSSLDVLGMPMPEQSLPAMFRHLREEQGVSRILVMASGTEEGIRQKRVAEQVAIDEGLDLVHLSLYDVSEETFDLDLNPRRIQHKVKRVVAAAPEALILVGCPPETFLVLVERLRSGGYEGYIGTQNFQDPRLLAKLGGMSDGVFYVGGASEGEPRSEYFDELKGRYLDLADQWSQEADTKLYALELILACIREAGIGALDETTVMYRILPEFSFKDPFYQEPRMLSIIGGLEDGFPRQIQTPIRISRMLGGQPILVQETMSVLP
ncbi:ABC transporter substrate-binding protein [Coraliomargarita sp. W4R53]